MSADKPPNKAGAVQTDRHGAARAVVKNVNQSNTSLPFSGVLNWVALLVIGGGIGWLVGLSVSPVVANVVAVIIAAAAALVATLGGWAQGAIQANPAAAANPAQVGAEIADAPKTDSAPIATDPPNQQNHPPPLAAQILRLITPVPLALLLLGIMVGSAGGLYVRNHSTFGSQLAYEVEKWTEQGLPQAEVARRLFEREHSYTPYIQPWLWVTNSVPISASAALTTAQLAVAYPISTEVNLWVNLGLDRTTVVSRLFDLKYPVNTGKPASTTSPVGADTDQNPPYDTALYAVEIPADKRAEVCTAWQVFAKANEGSPAHTELWNTLKTVIATTNLQEIIGLISADDEKKQIVGIMLPKIC